MKTNFLELKIIRPTKQEVFQVEWIDIQSPAGSFVVGVNHIPLISRLKKKGQISFKKYDGKTELIDTYGGFFKVEDNKAEVILEI
ncbi:MAG: hypothetical protein ABIA74_02480 [bacterium]